MLVCEALNMTMLERAISAIKLNSPLQAGNLEDVPSYHITTTEVAEIARDAGVGEVVLTHLVPSIVSQDPMEALFVQGMSDIYSGSIRVARDTQRLIVKGKE
jgi:ribonuclease Z